MSIDFLNTDCKEVSRTDKLIGICDDQNGEKAYTDTTQKEKWIAKVKNEDQLQVTFTAIDNCISIFKEGTNDQESTCDGMLTFAESLYLIELKNQRKGWILDAIGQLENTIKILSKNHDLRNIKNKKVFACNKKHPYFRIVSNERNKRFFQSYGFRIDVQAEIVVK
ncbi:MAG: hypothetical protein DHS20C18_42230 [Saprospiraceae bacterium]|nr:MAG: hypothetical protein DHS20C18_42230 [Saprospiraceae bacterium]